MGQALGKDAGSCGCGMVANTTRLNPNVFGRKLWRMKATENARAHTMESWWCKGCRHSEWTCLDTGMGRGCDGLRRNFDAGAAFLANN